jgi:hypothetical protein
MGRKMDAQADLVALKKGNQQLANDVPEVIKTW